MLRRAGAIATLDVPTRAIVVRAVCPAPRGVDADGSSVWVACEGGELVRVDADPRGATPSTTHQLPVDLRDVVVGERNLFVSRFKTAELISVDRSGRVLFTTRPNARAGFAPEVAWRLAKAPGDRVVMVHQLASTSPIIAPAYYSASPQAETRPVSRGVTLFVHGRPDRTIPLAAPTAVDVAVAENGDWLVPGIESVIDRVRGEAFERSPLGDVFPVAVATLGDGYVVQTREPDSLLIVKRGSEALANVAWLTSTNEHRGFDVFHRPTRTGAARMSCHPEGGEDDHTWILPGGEPRRTQSLRGGILRTTPLHWKGELRTIADVVTETFLVRMGGERLQPIDISALERFVDAIPALPALRVDEAALQRGKDIFESAQCASCHKGPMLTNNQSADVGTGGPWQVPSLVGVRHRAPYMHDGCAKTLLDRFTDLARGGASHGRTQGLTPNELSDLITYLESSEHHRWAEEPSRSIEYVERVDWSVLVGVVCTAIALMVVRAMRMDAADSALSTAWARYARARGLRFVPAGPLLGERSPMMLEEGEVELRVDVTAARDGDPRASFTRVTARAPYPLEARFRVEARSADLAPDLPRFVTLDPSFDEDYVLTAEDDASARAAPLALEDEARRSLGELRGRRGVRLDYARGEITLSWRGAEEDEGLLDHARAIARALARARPRSGGYR